MWGRPSSCDWYLEYYNALLTIDIKCYHHCVCSPAILCSTNIDTLILLYDVAQTQRIVLTNLKSETRNKNMNLKMWWGKIQTISPRYQQNMISQSIGVEELGLSDSDVYNTQHIFKLNVFLPSGETFEMMTDIFSHLFYIILTLKCSRFWYQSFDWFWPLHS